MVTDSKKARFVYGTLSGVIAQVLSVVIKLVSIPIAIAYLGPAKFGLWMVIVSLLAYVGLSQFGVGTAAAAMIAGEVDPGARARIFRQSVVLLGGLALLMVSIVGVAAWYRAAWVSIFGNVTYQLGQEAVWAALAIAFLYSVRLPAVAITSAFTGLQEVHWERFYGGILPSLLGLLALLVTIYLAGGLVMLAAATGLGQLIVAGASGIHLMVRHPALIRSSIRDMLSAPVRRRLLASGNQFFVIGVAAMVVWSTDNLVISYFRGPEHVTAYSVTFQLFVVAYSVFATVNSALWPMFGKAVGEGNWVWVEKVYTGTLAVLPVLGGLVWIGGILFAKSIILFWVGESGYGGMLVVFALGGYGYFLALVSTHAGLLSAMNATRGMVWIGILEAVVNFGLSVALIGWLGIGGVALGTMLSAILTVTWLLPIDVARQTDSRIRVAWSPVLRHLLVAVSPAVVAAFVVVTFLSGWRVVTAGVVILAVYLATSWRLFPVWLQRQVVNLARPWAHANAAPKS